MAKARPLKGLVLLRDDHVEKFTATPALMADKYQALHNIAKDQGFLAPAIMEVRPRSIVMERLRGIVPIRRAYNAYQTGALSEEAGHRLFRRVGAVLAAIHQKLPTDQAVPFKATPRIAQLLDRYCGRPIATDALPQRMLHGDFGFTNVFTSGEGDAPALAVIDPCPNYGSVFHEWEMGPVYLDIGKFVAGIESLVPARQRLRPPTKKTIALQKSFIDGYRERSGIALSEEMCFAFAYATVLAQYEYRHGWPLSYLQGLALYNPLKGNYPAKRKMRQVDLGQEQR